MRSRPRHPVRSSTAARRSALAALAAVALVLLTPLAASAHVKVSPVQSSPGADDVQLTFAVPNESSTAFTTKVVVELPTATPFGDVAFEPVPGWHGSVTEGPLPKPAKVAGTTVTSAPLKVAWTAGPGTKLTAGEVQDFTISAGPMPDTGRILLPAEQTYSDGHVVRWDQPTPANGTEPEHPAPTVYLADSAPGGATQQDGIGPIAIALAGAALVVALVAAVLALLAFLRAGRARPGQ